MRIHPRLAVGFFCLFICGLVLLVQEIFQTKFPLYFWVILGIAGYIPSGFIYKYFDKKYSNEDLLDETFKENPFEDKK